MNKKDLSYFREIVELIQKLEKEDPVAEPIPTGSLFDQLDLKLEEKALDDDAFISSLKSIITHTPKTSSNKFFNQLVGGRRSRSVLGDLIASVLNNSMYTYKAAGPMIGVEKAIIQKLNSLIGYPTNSEGTISSGSSMSNFMAMVLARDYAMKKVKDDGITKRMIVYTSEASHYSIKKNASLMGIGKNQVRFIKTDDYGRMSVEDLKNELEKDIDRGYVPFFVNVTSGTTVMGSFDEIVAINRIAKKHNVWVHVDGAYCGAVLFSKKYRHLIKGVEASDSFCMSAHKMLGTPLTCSILLTKHKKQLYESFSTDADYLYQTDDDDYNLGKTSLQCGRRNDALKLWTLWKSVGTNGIENLIDHQFYLAEVAREYVRSNPNYTLYSFDESVSICFNYKGIPAKKLAYELYMHAQLMVSHGSFKGTDFIRLVTINSDNAKQDIYNFFHTIESFVANNDLPFKENINSTP